MTSRGTTYALLAALGFAAVSTFTQLALDRGASLWNILMWRFVIAAAVMMAFVRTQRYAPLPSGEVARFVVLGGGGQALLIGLALSSLSFIDVATLAFLFYTYPAWVTLVQLARRVESLTARRVVALALSVTGTVLIAGRPDLGGDAWRGAVLAIAAAIVYAFYIPLMEWMQRDHPVPQTSAYAKVGSAVCFLALALWDGSVSARLVPGAWAAIVGLALLSTVIPGVLFLMALMRLGPVRTAIISTVEPLLTAVLGALVLRQAVTPIAWLGGALIVGAVVVLQLANPPKFVEN
jgi:drug/metabolite transporter (DMT)-like permease